MTTYDLLLVPEVKKEMSYAQTLATSLAETTQCLRINPFDPHLGTIPFVGAEAGGVWATPVRHTRLWIFWELGTAPHTIVILHIAEIPTDDEAPASAVAELVG